MTESAAIDAEPLRQAGRYDETLALLLKLTRAPYPDRRAQQNPFMLMYQWRVLVEAHPQARLALAELRDEEVEKLFADDCDAEDGTAGTSKSAEHVKRFPLIVGINEILDDSRSTYDTFVRLDAVLPHLACGFGWRAMPALVAAGDFALARQHLSDPLALLDCVKRSAQSRPLYPERGEPPRLAAELTNVASSVRLAMAVLNGTGDEAGATALRKALLAGLEDEALAALADRELDVPGTILREVDARQFAG